MDQETLQVLNDLRDRVLMLPDKVADMVQLTLATPGVQEEMGPEVAEGIEQPVAEMATEFDQAMAEAAAAPEYTAEREPELGTPEYLGPIPGEAAAAEYAAPGVAEAGAPEYVSPEVAEADFPEYQAPDLFEPGVPEYQAPELFEPGAPDYEHLPAETSEEAGREGEIIDKLDQIAARLGERAGTGAATRLRKPSQVAWRASFAHPEEGFSQGASPSQDVSTIAGAGGASSRRGFGTHGGGIGARYYHPEADVGPPR